MLDGESSQIGVRYKVAPRPSRLAQTREDRPVSVARHDCYPIWTVLELSGKLKRLTKTTRRPEYPRVGDDAYEAAYDQVAQRIRGFGVDRRFQPLAVVSVIGGVPAVRVHQNVDIRKDQQVIP